MGFLFTVLACIVLWVNAIKLMQGDGMFLAWLNPFFDKLAENKAAAWLLKPVWFCAPCMCSLHGLLVYFMLTEVSGYYFRWLEYLICAVCAVPLAYLLRLHVLKQTDSPQEAVEN